MKNDFSKRIKTWWEEWRYFTFLQISLISDLMQDSLYLITACVFLHIVISSFNLWKTPLCLGAYRHPINVTGTPTATWTILWEALIYVVTKGNPRRLLYCSNGKKNKLNCVRIFLIADLNQPFFPIIVSFSLLI